MSLYLIKSCVYVMAFYIPFTFILKRTTFFSLNRVYLVLGLLLSFTLPLYTEFLAIPVYTAPDLPFMEPIVTQTELAVSHASESTGSLSITALLLVFYLLGIAFRLIMLARSVTHTLKLKNQGEVLRLQDLNIIKTNTTIPFSFFHYVFLPRALDEAVILEHEAAHVRQHHWIDLLIVELSSIILWFNPVMIVYKRSLKQQHEYLADRAAIMNGIDLREYLTCIKQQIELVIPASLTSEFYFQSIKNRINMMTKKRTSVYGLAAYTMIVPIIICLLMAFSSREHFPIVVAAENDPVQETISLCLPIDKNNFLLESGYGERLHPVLGVIRLHTGIDLVADQGVPVVSTQEGLVIKAEFAENWGNIIVVQHDDTYTTSYSHLKSMRVKKGDRVQKGQKIGSVGNTGLSTKSHLHFELHKNGEAIDPITYLPGVK
jgi:hypothetical protein